MTFLFAKLIQFSFMAGTVVVTSKWARIYYMSFYVIIVVVVLR